MKRYEERLLRDTELFKSQKFIDFLDRHEGELEASASLSWSAHRSKIKEIVTSYWRGLPEREIEIQKALDRTKRADRIKKFFEKYVFSLAGWYVFIIIFSLVFFPLQKGCKMLNTAVETGSHEVGNEVWFGGGPPYYEPHVTLRLNRSNYELRGMTEGTITFEFFDQDGYRVDYPLEIKKQTDRRYEKIKLSEPLPSNIIFFDAKLNHDDSTQTLPLGDLPPPDSQSVDLAR